MRSQGQNCNPSQQTSIFYSNSLLCYFSSKTIFVKLIVNLNIYTLHKKVYSNYYFYDDFNT